MIQNKQKGLYIPSMEHESCGIGFTAHLKGKKSHDIIEDAITMLENMEHRGASGYEKNTGDGAGILMQNPHDFFAEVCMKLGFDLPNYGEYGVGMVSFPSNRDIRVQCREVIKANIEKFDFILLGYRRVPVNNTGLGNGALSVEPRTEQMFIKPKNSLRDPDALERRLFVIRKYINKLVRSTVPESEEQFHIATLSYKTIVYKGQLNAMQLRTYFPDLSDYRMKSGIALIHSRFSTNTFPKWKLAQPFRFLAHNGEINTIRGNLNWMRSYENLFHSSLFTNEEINLLKPLLNESESDSSNLDKTIEILLLGGRSLPHVLMMLIPEAWEENDLIKDPKRAFYEYHSDVIKPWDGPASICITDGKTVGATLDRNGLRPSRYVLTDDDRLIMASEAGALPVDPSRVVLKGRVEPGKMFFADLQQGRIISDEELKNDICSRQPYRKWLDKNSVHVSKLPKPEKLSYNFNEKTLTARLQAFGYTSEDLKAILAPMYIQGKEPLGSMGADTPLAVLSNESQHLSHYFKQLFAQVSNPPMDPIRERVVMSLFVGVGKTLDILGEKPEQCRQIHFKQPILSIEELEKIRNIEHPHFNCKTIHAIFKADGKKGTLEKALDQICQDAEDAIRFGNNNIILISDRKTDKNHAPIPSLLATGAIHHHLTNKRLRVRTGIIVEAGDARETHHFATLIGYGANAICPYMAYEAISALKNNHLLPDELSDEDGFTNYAKAINTGLLKIFSKMGISTLHSYHGAQIFEIIGLSQQVVDKCFKRSISRIGGLDFDGIAKEVLVRHHLAYPEKTNPNNNLVVGGLYQWRRRGDNHLFNPETVHLLQLSTKTGNYDMYKKYAGLINNQDKNVATIRGLFDFESPRRSILLEEVEPREKIFKRFSTGAMSFGSLSYEAHSTLAVAMNRIGGRSNSGEGGEDPIRFEKKSEDHWERSSIKQIASGRFGVSSYYLTNADELQIKMAQGAKPGEGGQLPGHKVDEWIARVRNSTPGVGLISPPPHHDIYSIEDLKQLIFDLKNANREARISVKLVSEAGVGTIAAGVAKAHADVILISGGDGGTGASPLSSIRHAGLPWEMGLAEAHQTLVANNLRSRVTLQTDGQIKTGRDLAIAALLGAEEWGIATAALVVMGCVLMRKCHSNTCPVGVATQDPRLRKLFRGNPEYLVNYFTFMAEELREIMAQLGFRTVDEMIGQSNVISVKDVDNWKVKNLDLTPIVYKPQVDKSVGLYKQIEQEHEIENVLDWDLLQTAKPAIDEGVHVQAEFKIKNINRAVGTLLSNEISKKYKDKGLSSGSIHYKFKGSAGQSFGAFAVHGLHFELEGEANDYFGKGLSGAGLIVYPDKESKFVPEENVIVGNVAFYGGISGESFIRGLAGQRFCVRNSGVRVVVEGIGDHGCEYMTGGAAVILGPTGRNFAAGMSGGVAYIYDHNNSFTPKCNMELVEIEELDDEDDKILHYLIDKHYKLTGSTIAEKIINNWDSEIKKMLKVMPKDYKRVLTERKQKLSNVILNK